MIQLDFEKPLIELKKKVEELTLMQEKDDVDLSDEISSLSRKLEDKKKEIYSGLTRWQRVLVARHPDRPYTNDYIEALMNDFVELHGDRGFRDDPAVITGLAQFRGRSVVVVGQQKGRNLEQRQHRNFGMMHPEGYRKAMRIMRLGERFSLPVVIFIDTPGAYPGIGAEERGQAEAIARNLMDMAALKTPIVITIIGEGASGGALGIGVGDKIMMMENAWYSVISPEGCAAILWRDAKLAPKAAEALKLSSYDLLELGMIDEIIPEPPGGAHWDPDETYHIVGEHIEKALNDLVHLSGDEIVTRRYRKYREMGIYRTK